MSYIIIRKKGMGGPCSACDRDVEVFSQEAAEARFLIIRLAERPSLGGGECPKCKELYCVSCATKTVYGKGMRRIHCPACGSLLVGIQYKQEGGRGMGGFLSDPPEFSGKGSAKGTEAGASEHVAQGQ